MNFVKGIASLDDRAVGSLALGVAGLFFFNVVFGPTAIALGAITAHRHAAGSPSRNAGLIAVALGVADLLVLGVLMAAQIRGGSLVWHV
ncbi:hypothetical protein GCM10010168_88280 [Actinoplanes ianthinogenes]|uniref:DUF4190 domain-containing protein n=1 Tax=Actinoplanes ianthinogenes TaxID=122358 RepID=A0ABM7LRR2_9ACTN|nr:DUF4190 domain-containing protein [Actinoplanes ianthinogenes]BCJ41932.1 hypothetical protein Aiant_25890 [Actinoplanes ianthinogenes]GGR55698.1 hypothetical protein GCM10010168_88280 [Actinoplanes ianthinogenes]